jgi:hypothetical protein
MLIALNYLNVFTRIEYCDAIPEGWCCYEALGCLCKVLFHQVCYDSELYRRYWNDVQCMSLVRNPISPPPISLLMVHDHILCDGCTKTWNPVA